jgi:hypothetical protein
MAKKTKAQLEAEAAEAAAKAEADAAAQAEENEKARVAAELAAKRAAEAEAKRRAAEIALLTVEYEDALPVLNRRTVAAEQARALQGALFFPCTPSWLPSPTPSCS